MVLWLCQPGAWAQQPELRQLNQVLQHAAGQSASLDSDRQILIARFALLQNQAEALLQGGGDWEPFFRFYQVTQQQVSRLSPLPPAVAGPWSQIQTLMLEIGRKKGQSLPPLSSITAEKATTAVLPATLSQAARALDKIELSLNGPPPGCDLARYQEARDNLAALRQSLQSGKATQIARQRRRFQLSRSALQMPAARFWELDQALDEIPAL
ncbi:hypothetical protein IV102_24010 [bacterium]|nr:hypothetical protein [bacterium]